MIRLGFTPCRFAQLYWVRPCDYLHLQSVKSISYPRFHYSLDYCKQIGWFVLLLEVPRVELFHGRTFASNLMVVISHPDKLLRTLDGFMNFFARTWPCNKTWRVVLVDCVTIWFSCGLVTGYEFYSIHVDGRYNFAGSGKLLNLQLKLRWTSHFGHTLLTKWEKIDLWFWCSMESALLLRF